MNSESARAAANIIWGSWESGERLRQLPDGCRPRNLEEGYAVQAMLEEVSGYGGVGWKIAATNVTGQRHIGVEGPIGGRLLAGKVVSGDGPVPMAGSHTRRPRMLCGSEPWVRGPRVRSTVGRASSSLV